MYIIVLFIVESRAKSLDHCPLHIVDLFRNDCSAVRTGDHWADSVARLFILLQLYQTINYAN